MTTSSPSSTAEQQSARDQHLFGSGPKRILALDGGGVRGAITVAFLERIELLLSQHHGRDIRLGDQFDLVGGTSTGAIIAGALALGYRTDQVKNFYIKLTPYVFKHQRWRIPILRAKFDSRGLRKQIEDVVGERLLESHDLITGLAIVAKRMDTGSPWIISNNPRAPYWEDGANYIGNKHYPLVNLVRASTAAPHFFDPEVLAISRNEMLPDDIAKPLNQPWIVRVLTALLRLAGLRQPVTLDPNQYGLFVDGGVTPHGNPALALLQIVTLKALGITWPATPDQLSIVSVGTGSHRPRLTYDNLGFARFPKLAYHALTSMMSDSETLVLELMQWLGETVSPWEINSEIGTLADDAPPGGKMFRFLRYDVRLERDWLSRELGCVVSETDIARFRQMDDPGIVHALYEIGRAAAERQVKLEHWSI
jgi:predicted acylesterase/phospholipase RssA